MKEDYIIRIENLTKTFHNKQIITAVNEISFNVNRGEIFGLLGPNGAGKSTLIRILTTLLKPTSGTAFVGSFEITKYPEEIRKIIGVCPQNSTLDIELTAYDNLEFYGNLTNVPDTILIRRIWQLLEMANLKDRAHMKVQTFSGGMRRKLEIVRAFIHEPLILFLDEPTIGLDPESRREVWDQITKLNAADITIILTTHYMDEADKLCGRIAFVDNGLLIALNTPENLKRSISLGDLIEIGCEHGLDQVVANIKADPSVDSVEVKGQKILISTKRGNEVLPLIISVFHDANVPMTSISIRPPSLEDVFIYLTGRGLSDTAFDIHPTLRRGN